MKRLALLSLVFAAIVLSGCTINIGNSNNGGADGGVFKSTTKGQNWQQLSLIPTTSGKPNTLAGLNASVLEIDPSDSSAIYYGGLENGLFYSYDGAESWQPVKQLQGMTIAAMAVDPKDKCTLYAAVGNRLVKSEDCNRTWEQVYYDNETEVSIMTVAIDHYDSQYVYIGTSRGDVILSSDAAVSWRTVARLENPVKEVAVNPSDSRVVFAATANKGLFRSRDKGENWESLADRLQEFSDSTKFRDLYASKSNPGLVILANDYGLIRSTDNGDSWASMKLITPEKEAVITSVFASEHNANEIFYVTTTTFYGTSDNGENWATRKLPSTRVGWLLREDPDHAGTLYLGVKQVN